MEYGSEEADRLGSMKSSSGDFYLILLYICIYISSTNRISNIIPSFNIFRIE